MKSLISLVLSGLLVGCNGEAIANRKKPPCSYPIEIDSKTNKVYTYPKFGISMVMPDNLVSMLRQNGSIDIIDKGTYKLLQCPEKFGRGAPGTRISWANDTVYFYSINIKENVDLYIRYEEGYYLIILRLVNKKGQLIDITIYDEGPIDKSNVRGYIKDYIKLGRTIEFL